MLAAARSPVRLPQALGPKLPPFTLTAEADIEFIEELGDRESENGEVVGKVRINGEETFSALNMVSAFKFQVGP
jgi:hypothetical protein